MGFNDHMEDEPLYASVDKHVCSDCVTDVILIKIVDDNSDSHRCDYCGRESDELVAAPFDEVMAKIYEAITSEYADAQDLDLPWAEGGWIIPETDAQDVVGNFDPGWPGDFIDDVLDSLGWQQYWVPHTGGDWAITNPSQTLRYGWDSFKDQIILKTRYLFLSEPTDKLEYGRPDYIPVSVMLDALGNVINRLDLVTKIPARTPLFRTRALNAGQTVTTFDEVAVPPRDRTSAGRMNPPGIPYLYLGFDENTSILETIFKIVPYALAEFVTKKELLLVDLAKLPDLPSPFEPDRYQERYEGHFIRNFQSEITKPITKNGQEHVDYVPTQVVSEYLRYRFKNDSGNRVDGLTYPSVKNQGGVNVALFSSDNEAAADLIDLNNIEIRHSI